MGTNNKRPGWPRMRLPKNFTAIVTGGNKGLGHETAKQLAFLGAHVIIGCRNENRAKAGMLRMEADFMEFKDSLGEDSDFQPPDFLDVEYLPLDLSRLDSVVQFADRFKSKRDKHDEPFPLHALICNAGIAGVPQDKTDDGYEMHFQVNFLGHLLLTLHLLPVMRNSGEDVRIINVSSSAHSSGEMKVKTMQGRGNYNAKRQYANSKLYQVMTMYALDRRLKDSNVRVYAVNPGKVETDLYDSEKGSRLTRASLKMGKAFGSISTSLTKGATSIINLAVNPNLAELSGHYFSGGVPTTTPKATNEKSQEILWKYAMGCLKDHLARDLVFELSVRE